MTINYSLVEIDKFEKAFNKLPLHIKERFKKQFKRLEEDPYSIGKSLGYKWLRELKNEGYRVYYLIYDEDVIVLLVGVSDKKNQKEVILFIKSNIIVFREFVKSKYYKGRRSLI